jgi:hypothetical protein
MNNKLRNLMNKWISASTNVRMNKYFEWLIDVLTKGWPTERLNYD